MKCLVLLAFASAAYSQTGFDELARQAAAALDVEPARAAQLYAQALKLKPDWAEGWFYLGASQYQLGDFQKAREAFRKTTVLSASNGSAWAFLGLAEYGTGEFDPALRDLQKGEGLGLGDNPGFASAVRTHAAFLLIRGSEFQLAMEQLQPLALQGDKSAELIQAYGLAALAIPSLPANLPAQKLPLIELAGKAAAALSGQRQNEAAEYFRQLAAQYSNEPGVHYAYGFYLSQSDPDAAVKEYQSELKVNPSHVFARLQIAFIEIKQGSFEDALGLGQEAVKLAPRNYLCHSAVGRALLGLGQLDKALDELRIAVTLAPENAQNHFYLEQAYRRAGRRDEAAKEKSEFNRLFAQQDPLGAVTPK